MNSSKRESEAVHNPRILIVTPEITYLPPGMGNMANRMNAKAGGLADVSASLVAALFELGADVHVALPHYRRMFHVEAHRLIDEELRVYTSKLPDAQIHLAEDRVFYYRNAVYSAYHHDSTKLALAFQREVINNIIPRVSPDLIHCNDWMTGLIPAMARRLGIPCLFTVHNIHTQKLTLAEIEDRGIDAAEFWPYLYYDRQPIDYEKTRATNPVDMLTSGIFAGHFINTVSPTFLREIVAGRHGFIPASIRTEMAHKAAAGCAVGILNAPDASFNPAFDERLSRRYTAADHVAGKRENKLHVQECTGLRQDPDAPLFFWPSRLDPIQKGCQLLTDILYDTTSSYRQTNMQLLVVANGSYQKHFHNIVKFHGLHDRVAVCDFDETLSHLGYAGADFMIMPSLFEPCGLPQMIGAIYGTLPIVHDTGGLHDTISHLNIEAGVGNGFVFETYNSGGLRWAIDQAMAFHGLGSDVRQRAIARVMTESTDTFNHAATAKKYFDIYENMLNRPLINTF